MKFLISPMPGSAPSVDRDSPTKITAVGHGGGANGRVVADEINLKKRPAKVRLKNKNNCDFFCETRRILKLTAFALFLLRQVALWS